MSLAYGRKLLFELGVKQGVCLRASIINQEKKLEWLDSLSKNTYRDKISKFKDTSLLMIISQACDIAASDNIESSIELVICKKIKERDVYKANTFVSSVRKFQFKFGEDFFEANVDYILTVGKKDFHEVISSAEDFEVLTLSDDYTISIPVWRANRYNRIALPDNFVKSFKPLEEEVFPVLMEASLRNDYDSSSYLRALYMSVTPSDEADNYEFQFFGLLRDDTTDEIMSNIQDCIEDMASNLEEKAGYIDKTDNYADRGKSITVSFLSSLVKYNADFYSLSQGNDDLGENLA